MKHLRFRVFLLLIILPLASCSSRYLEIKSEYFDKNFLASQQVDTPDPLRACFQGQQLIVKWRLPWNCIMDSEEVTLSVTVRFGDRSVETYSIPVKQSRGWWVLRLINNDYWCKGGMISYKAEIIADGTLIQSWRHHIWVDLIEINAEEEPINNLPERLILPATEPSLEACPEPDIECLEGSFSLPSQELLPQVGADEENSVFENSQRTETMLQSESDT